MDASPDARGERGVRAAGAREECADRSRLELLGGFSFWVGGQPLELPLSAQRLLAFLALQERSLLRGYVAGSLWPGSTDQRAAASLRTSLWRLQLNGHSPVVASPSHLSVNDDLDIDVRDTQRVARAVLSGQGPTLSRSDVEVLVDARDLLADWYDEWLRSERDQTRELRLRALEVLCEQLTVAGRFAEAAEAGLAAIQSDPLRESAQRALIRLHLEEGNPSEALRRHREYAALLERRLGLPPSHLMQELVLGATFPRPSR